MIKDNLKSTLAQINGRAQLIAVSKKKPNEALLEAYNVGQRDFGENYVQELVEKSESLPKDIKWHMIGHLQTNKVKYIAPFVYLIHSVDSEKLLKEINKQGKKNERIINVLLQLHIAEEDSKTGFDKTELLELLKSEKLDNYQNIKVLGLMGMSTFTENEQQVEREFSSLKQLNDEIKKEQLPKNVTLNEISMGMSGDWELALKHGSTMLRIGSSIFGLRN